MKSVNLDPRTILFINIIFCIGVFAVSGNIFNFLTFGVALLLMIVLDLKKDAFKFLLIYGVLYIINDWIMASDMNMLKPTVGMLLYIVTKFIPIIMIMMVIIKKVKINELISSLEKMNMPKGIILSLIVALRMIPTLKEEYRFIKESMVMKGIEISFKNVIAKPVKTVEYFLVPLLIRCLKLCDELTATALVRGIESENKRSSVVDVSLKTYDYGFMIGLTFVTGLLIFLDK